MKTIYRYEGRFSNEGNNNNLTRGELAEIVSKILFKMPNGKISVEIKAGDENEKAEL